MSRQSLAWGAKVSPDFRARVFRLCDNLNWSDAAPDYLMACMAFETGRSFSPSQRNYAGGSAIGLIQFMPATARGLGTSREKLARMSAVQQLDYVERYFRPQASRIRTLEDMYMAILWPRGVGRAMEYVLWKTGTRAYAANRGLDKNRDGRVTKYEAAAKVREQLQLGRQPGNIWVGSDHETRVMVSGELPPITALQRALNKYRSSTPLLVEDGIIGPKTREALRNFQRKNGLHITGVSDEATWRALGLRD